MAYAEYEFHLSQFRAHLSGTTPHPLPASFIAPTGYWTSAEKDAFFHGLQIHSRIRPDLIAAGIKTKTAIDVCTYIDLLDAAAEEFAPVPSLRALLKPAMEMSDLWIEHEESQAPKLVEMEREMEKDEPDDMSDTENDTWQKENALSRLNVHHLSALDKMRRHAFRDPPSDGTTAPESKRRAYKRLYMRKKRAETTGTDADLDSVKLIVGRKVTRLLGRKPRPAKYKVRGTKKWIHSIDGGQQRKITPAVTLEVQESSSSSGDSDTKHTRKGGLPSVSRATRELEKKGIDASVLSDSELDVFALSVLGKLMKSTHNDVAPEGVEEKFRTCLSFETVVLLKDILLDFITPVIHNAISLREKEVTLKQDITVWRLDKQDEITASNVNDALRMHPQSYAFATEEDRSEVESNASESDDEGERRFTEDKADFPLRLSLAREIMSPFINLLTEDDDDDLLAADTDEDELICELDEEVVLDGLDRQKEVDYDKELWIATRQHVL
ncbi:hypothetical protein MIND_00080000 [Mycena indigotica]|uniref:Uncharacterized protein n=1 Tax=Mycena indigotica TaxID=2126181 RepID=A0A8H6TDV1_9AGAR|nr:uncharacterized protein MIND_00080000 [Mycena indigotica]KAF7315645.1 hypothetical protein MIND_00080000 [Mycena indigotica]